MDKCLSVYEVAPLSPLGPAVVQSSEGLIELVIWHRQKRKMPSFGSYGHLLLGAKRTSVPVSPGPQSAQSSSITVNSHYKHTEIVQNDKHIIELCLYQESLGIFIPTLYKIYVLSGRIFQ